MRFPYKAYADMVARERETSDTQHDAKSSAAESDASDSAIDDETPLDTEDEQDDDISS